MNTSKNHISKIKVICNASHHYVLTGLCLLFIAVSITLTGCDILSKNNDEDAPNDGIVHSVVKAPVVPDGDVVGKTTDIVLNLDVSMDPNEPGFSLREGDKIKVILPEAFKKRQDLQLLNIFDCLAQNLQCDTIVPLLGWPQGALGAPPPVGYEVSYEGSHTMVITATEDHIVNPPSNPGLKQIHLLLNSFTNPAPAEYPIDVEITNDEGVQHGIGLTRILAETQPSIEVTNAFHSFLNTNFQKTEPDSLVPLPFDFLLWNSEGLPIEGATIEGNQLMRENEVIGRVSIEAPSGASGQEVFTETPSVSTNAPVTGIPAGHLRAFFRAGSVAGEYRVAFQIKGGNTAEMTVRVQ